uniref:Uncharacterized protein n=1 Tax=Arachis duranensis TaxID=130453 RepID=N1NKG4_ARADU|nr:hypothetical protein ARAX_ADH179B13-001 [Arachis duranensis]
MYELEKLSMTKLMDGNDSQVAISTDMLTSNQEKGYVVVTAHYIDNSWILQMRVLRGFHVAYTLLCSYLEPNCERWSNLVKKSVEKICGSVVYWTSSPKRHETFILGIILLGLSINSQCYNKIKMNAQNPSNSSNTFEDSTIQELKMNAEQDDDAIFQLHIRQKKMEKGSFVNTQFDHYIEKDVHSLSADFDILAS